MKVLSWLVGVPLGIVVLVFALSNRQAVILGLWPFDDGLALPLYLIVLLPLLIGFLAGLLLAGVSTMKQRRLVRRQTKAVAALERQLDAVKSASEAVAPLPQQLSTGDRSAK